MNKEYCNSHCFLTRNLSMKMKPKVGSKISLILFDMDGVLVDTISSWRFIHNYFSTDNQESVKAYINGEIDDYEFIRKDVNKWRVNNISITNELLGTILKDISYMKGAEACLKRLYKKDIKTAIVSAGIKLLANRIAKELHIDYVYANELLVDMNNRLTGEGIVQVPLKHKDRAVYDISTSLGIPTKEILAVGNSCFDIPLLLSVGIGVAFNPEDDCIAKYADEIIYQKDLSLLLPIIEKYHNLDE